MRNDHRPALLHGLVVGGAVAILLSFLWATDSFGSLRLRLNDIYFVPVSVSDRIVIVALDNASLADFGQRLGELPRSLYADLINTLSQAGARVIAFDLLFDIPTDDDAALARAIEQARTQESRTRIVLAATGESRIFSQFSSQTLQFERALLPQPALLDAGAQIGFVNVIPDSDTRIRRQPSLIEAGRRSGYAFAIATYLAYLRIPESAFAEVVSMREGALEITAERTLAVDSLGMWRQNYFGPPSAQTITTFETVSMRDVLANVVDPETFEDKIVLVGVMNSTGSTEQHVVPVVTDGRLMAGLEVHANAIETILQNHMLSDHAGWVQAALIVIFSLGAGVVYAQLRWYWAIIAAVAATTLWLVICLLQFGAQHQVINLFDSSLALLLPVIGTTGLNLSREIRRRQVTEFLLDSIVQASNQRLELNRILEAIESDVRRITNSTAGAIILNGEGNQSLELRRQWGRNDSSLLDTDEITWASRAASGPQTRRHTLTVPIRQHRRTLADIILEFPPDQQPGVAQRRLLDGFAQRVAPVLDNALLFEETRRQKAVLEAVLAGSPSGILVLDPQMTVLMSNARAAEILNQDAAAIAGKQLVGLLEMVQPDTQSLGEKLRHEFGDSAAFRHEIQIGERSFILDAAPLPTLAEWVVILNDITALADLNRLKTFMIRMGSHELKNPLSRIMVYGDLLLNYETEETPLTDQSRQFIGYMLRSADQMKHIISDILDLELLRVGKIEREPVDVRGLVQDVVAQIKADTDAKHQELIVRVSETVPQVIGNDRQLALMITNLLTNAVKYTPEGGQVCVRLLTSQNGAVRLEIQDTGYGIPGEAQKKLFTEFYRVRTDATASIPGTGLGLSLVKSIIDLHQGRVWLHSEEGAGSTFFVELPALVD